MAKKQNAVFAEIRRRDLLDLVNAKGRITVNELCEKLAVSPATIRSDLNELEKRSLVKRAHGGAISITDNWGPELTSREKVGLHAAQKRTIAQLALSYVAPGQVVAIDTGTTTTEFAKLLVDIRDLTVITNDLKIALFLEEHSNLSVILLGGTVRKNFHCTVGQTVLEEMDSLHIDTFFLATNAMNLEWGLSTPSVDIASVKSKMIQSSKQVVLLSDSSKIGASALSRFATLDQIHVLITDGDADPQFLAGAQALGVKIECT